MLKLFRDLLGKAAGDETAADAPRLPLAAAALLLETARSDSDIDESELRLLRQRLGQSFDLSRQELDALTDTALTEVDDAVGFHQFTSVVNAHYDYDERVALVRALWDVALADAHIDAFEEHTVRRIADLLHVAHRDFIQAKLDARDSAR